MPSQRLHSAQCCSACTFYRANRREWTSTTSVITEQLSDANGTCLERSSSAAVLLDCSASLSRSCTTSSQHHCTSYRVAAQHASLTCSFSLSIALQLAQLSSVPLQRKFSHYQSLLISCSLDLQSSYLSALLSSTLITSRCLHSFCAPTAQCRCRLLLCRSWWPSFSSCFRAMRPPSRR